MILRCCVTGRTARGRQATPCAGSALWGKHPIHFADDPLTIACHDALDTRCPGCASVLLRQAGVGHSVHSPKLSCRGCPSREGIILNDSLAVAALRAMPVDIEGAGLRPVLQRSGRPTSAPGNSLPQQWSDRFECHWRRPSPAPNHRRSGWDAFRARRHPAR